MQVLDAAPRAPFSVANLTGMVRFEYRSQSGTIYSITVIAMNDGTIDAYAALLAEPGAPIKEGKRGARDLPLAVADQWAAEVRTVICQPHYEAAKTCLTFAPYWTKPGTRTDYPQPLSFFLT